MTGALKPTVVYPVANSLVEARDSNFIFGSRRQRDARSCGSTARPVPVAPNGAFLAFLPVSAGRQPALRTRRRARARIPRASSIPCVCGRAPIKLATDGVLAYDTTSVTPGSRLALRDDDTVRVSVRTAPNASVIWRGEGGAAQALTAAGTSFAADMPARVLRGKSELVLARGSDTIHVAIPPVGIAFPGQWSVIGVDSAGADASDEELIGRPIPSGTYKWFLLPGTALEVTGRNGDYSRVRLDSRLEIWVSTADLHPLRAGVLPPHRVAGNARLVPQAEWVDLVVPMAARPPYFVDEGANELTVTLYDTVINTDIVNYGANDSLVREAKWTQESSDRGHFTLQLGSAAVRLSRVLAERLVRAARAAPAAHRSGLAATRTHDRGRSRTSTHRRDGTDGTVRAGPDARGGARGAEDARVARRESRDDALHRRPRRARRSPRSSRARRTRMRSSRST